MTRKEWDAFSRGSAIRRAGYAGFKRNIVAAMGNWLASVDDPAEEAVAVLRHALEGDEALVRDTRPGPWSGSDAPPPGEHPESARGRDG